jgi:hypothetical protein
MKLLPRATTSAFLAVLMVSLAAPFAALAQRGGAPNPAASKPIPRFPDGHPSFGPAPGEKGVWGARGSTMWDLDPADSKIQNANLMAPDGFPGKLKWADVPFQPWARALSALRRPDMLEPYTRCKPSGAARQAFTPYGTEFFEVPELKRFYITNTGGPHSFKIIYMDGREHPKDLEPSYFGHSVGHWEGETLVVDTVGFNERFWMDRPGTPHTEQLHLIERYTRTDYVTMKYEITVDDPGAYTKPWTGGFMMAFTPGQESFEFICQDNNRTPEINSASKSRVVP